jgi:hypothetical protein
MELIAQMSQEAIAAYLLAGVSVAGSIIVTYGQFREMRHEIRSIKTSLDELIGGKSIPFVRIEDRLGPLERAIAVIRRVLFNCKSCRESAVELGSIAADLLPENGGEHSDRK